MGPSPRLHPPTHLPCRRRRPRPTPPRPGTPAPRAARTAARHQHEQEERGRGEAGHTRCRGEYRFGDGAPRQRTAQAAVPVYPTCSTYRTHPSPPPAHHPPAHAFASAQHPRPRPLHSHPLHPRLPSTLSSANHTCKPPPFSLGWYIQPSPPTHTQAPPTPPPPPPPTCSRTSRGPPRSLKVAKGRRLRCISSSTFLWTQAYVVCRMCEREGTQEGNMFKRAPRD